MLVNNESKRIAFLIGSMGKGGAERVISVLANSYAERGWQVDILLLLNNSCDYDLNSNINIISICNENRSRIAQLPSWISNIRKYVKDKKPNNIISFIARINLITILACIGLNKSLFISERNDPIADGRSVFVRLATHILYPLADCVIFQTKWAQSCFSRRIQRKSVVIPNPIQVTTMASNYLKEKKIIAVGRLIEQKNHVMLIRAFKDVYEKYPDYNLVIYGEGRLRDTLQNLIKELKLTDAVDLPGNISNIHEKIANAEMFVLSSDYEGLSNALLEAMMMGLPCISTDCAGSNEVIINGISGTIVEVGNQKNLEEGIIFNIQNKEIAYEMAMKAKETVNEFGLDKIINKWDNLLEDEG